MREPEYCRCALAMSSRRIQKYPKIGVPKKTYSLLWHSNHERFVSTGKFYLYKVARRQQQHLQITSMTAGATTAVGSRLCMCPLRGCLSEEFLPGTVYLFPSMGSQACAAGCVCAYGTGTHTSTWWCVSKDRRTSRAV